MFEEQKAQIVKDRHAYFKEFFDDFYNVDKLAPERISDQAWQASFVAASGEALLPTFGAFTERHHYHFITHTDPHAVPHG